MDTDAHSEQGSEGELVASHTMATHTTRKSLTARNASPAMDEPSQPFAAWDGDEDGEDKASLEFGEDQCKNIILSPADLPFTIKDELKVPWNPFKMRFPDPYELQYCEWVHMGYWPARGWLALSALLGEIDLATYGMLAVTTDALLMHIVIGFQLLVLVSMCLPWFKAYRRFLVYFLFLHNFFWTGVVTQQTTERHSATHQNTFIILPYYCAFICVVCAQVPVRHAMWIFSFLPFANALWRVLFYYTLPSASVLLVWWWMIGCWSYTFERITRQLFGWLQMAQAAQKDCEDQRGHTASLLRSLIPNSVIKMLQRVGGAESGVENFKTKNAKSTGQTTQQSTTNNLTESDNRALVVVISFAPREKTDRSGPASFPALKELDGLTEAFGFQRAGFYDNRYSCVLIHPKRGSAPVKLQAFFASVLALPAASEYVTQFAVHSASAVSGLLVTSRLCRHTVLSTGLKSAHQLTNLLRKDLSQRDGEVLLARSTFPSTDLEMSRSQVFHRDTKVAEELSIDDSDDLMSISISSNMVSSPKNANANDDTDVGDSSAAIEFLLSVLNHSSGSGDSNEDQLGPVPKILWKKILSLGGLRFAFDQHETNFRMFVLRSVPELFFVLGGCQLFCGFWTIVTLLAVILPCNPTSAGGVVPWILSHALVFAVSCAVIARLMRQVRAGASGNPVEIKRLATILFVLIFVHYALGMASLIIQPNLRKAGNWEDYVAAVTKGQNDFRSFDNQLCINMTYNMTYFLIFALMFCLAAIPLYLSTTFRVGLILTIFFAHALFCLIYIHHIDMMELGVMVCILMVLVVVDALIRQFYKTLLVANRCRLEIEQQPEMQNRHVVMLACMPERLMDAPNHVVHHQSAGVLWINFIALEELLQVGQFASSTMSSSIIPTREIFADFVYLISVVQNVFIKAGVEMSIVHVQLQNGSPGMVILVPPQAYDAAFCSTFRELAHKLGRTLMSQPLYALSFPPVFRMACVVCPVVEWNFAGSHQIAIQTNDNERMMMDGCLVNSIAVGSFGDQSEAMARRRTRMSSVHTAKTGEDSLHEIHSRHTAEDLKSIHSHHSQSQSQGLEETRSSISSECVTRSTGTGVTHSTGAGAGPATRRTTTTTTASNKKGKGKGTKKYVATVGSIPNRSFIVLSWSLANAAHDKNDVPESLTPRSVGSREGEEVKPGDAALPFRIVGVDRDGADAPLPSEQTTRFNRSYVQDLVAIHAMLRTKKGTFHVQQTTQEGFHLVIIVEGHNVAEIARSLYDVVWNQNKATYCLGMGITCGQVHIPTGRFLSSALAFQALRLADQNAYWVQNDPKFGLPILMSSLVKQRVEYENWTKPLVIGGQKVFRLCHPMNAGPTNEWMYELADNTKDDVFALYAAAFTALTTGNRQAALHSVEAYLDKHPDDADAQQLKGLITRSEGPLVVK